MTERCFTCGSELRWIESENQYYCNTCDVYPYLNVQDVQEPEPMPVATTKSSPTSGDIVKRKFWTLKGWAKGWAYYNIYFDATGFRAIRLDLVSAGRVLIGGSGLISKLYSSFKRKEEQQQYAGLGPDALMEAGFSVDHMGTYDDIKSITYKGGLFKKLILETTEETVKFKPSNSWEDPRAELESIPQLKGKLFIK